MFHHLKLSTKFTLIFAVIFIDGVLISGFFLFRTTENRAQDDVATRGLLMLEAMNGVRSYTSENISPLLEEDLATEDLFISESVPAFSAREVFENFRTDEDHEDFFYKEATLNPTNLRNLADGFEAELVKQFRADPDLGELNGFRTLNGTRVFYIARPLTISSESCLVCHGDPADAPASMINSYGSDSGFGWQLNETVSAQMIYVPAQEVFNNARLTFVMVIAIFLAVFSIIVLALNLVMRPTVVRPMSYLAGFADKIRRDELTSEDLNELALSPMVTRGDEVGQLARTFSHMARQVQKREQNLKNTLQQLRIEIDSAKRVAQVSEITDSEHFRNLKERAKNLRERGRDDPSGRRSD